jgi:Ion channel
MKLRQLIRATENKYNRLLTIIILLYLVSPFLVDRKLGDLIVVFVFSLSLVLIVYQINRSKLALRFNLGLVFLGLLFKSFSSLALINPRVWRWLELSSKLIFLAFICLSVYSILRELIPAERVTSDIIKGGICVYFLFGFSWAVLYDIVHLFNVNSFNPVSADTTRADLLHFSFSTLTTVGYGDISPASEMARVLANLEGIVGVMYPAVFIARLVGLQSNR